MLCMISRNEFTFYDCSKEKKQSLLIFCEISTELTLHAVTNLACPFYTSEVRELSEFIVVPGVFLCDSVTLEI